MPRSRSRTSRRAQSKPGVAVKLQPKLWEQAKRDAVKRLGGKWSARAAQLAVSYYKKRGGKYKGKKQRKNSLAQWTREKWRTKSGKKSSETGERYLPEAIIRRLSAREYSQSSTAKRRDSRRGRQWSKQPRGIAAKVSRLRKLLHYNLKFD
jgi:hypothetical protein